MGNARLIHPTYAERFRCIGAACEDTCCQGWNVPIDHAAALKYQALPEGPLRTLIQANLRPAPKSFGANAFAIIKMNQENQCPLLTSERLCRIQTEWGEGLLSHACAAYPRIVHRNGDSVEMALTLSCPEAARLVLLSTDLLAEPTGLPSATTPRIPEPGAAEQHLPFVGAAPSTSAGANSPVPVHFWRIRETVIGLVTNRDYPLWQRMFLLGLLCRRLDAIARGELPRTVPEFLVGFEASLLTGTLRPAMDTLPVDHRAQLDVVLRLAGLMLHRSNVSQRFVACVQDFTAGIGNGPGATLESLTANYAAAHDRSFAPFFERHPHILENYLVNTILRCRFPFGREGTQPSSTPSMMREYALLTAQFALIKGLLIGVAGAHREQFSTAHVVHTVQTAARHFEHHPEFLNEAHALLVESRMDGALGLAILLRHSSQRRGSAGPWPASPAVEKPGHLTPKQD